MVFCVFLLIMNVTSCTCYWQKTWFKDKNQSKHVDCWRSTRKNWRTCERQCFTSVLNEMINDLIDYAFDRPSPDIGFAWYFLATITSSLEANSISMVAISLNNFSISKKSSSLPSAFASVASSVVQIRFTKKIIVINVSQWWELVNKNFAASPERSRSH